MKRQALQNEQVGVLGTAFRAGPKSFRNTGPVSQKSRNFSRLFRVPQFPLYRRNAEV